MRGVTLFSTETNSSSSEVLSSSSGWSQEVLLACDAFLSIWIGEKHMISFKCKSRMEEDTEAPCTRMLQKAFNCESKGYETSLTLKGPSKDKLFVSFEDSLKVLHQNITDLKTDIDGIINELEGIMAGVSDEERISIWIDTLKKSTLCRLLWTEDKDFESLQNLWESMKPTLSSTTDNNQQEFKKELVINQLNDLKEEAEDLLTRDHMDWDNCPAHNYLNYHYKLRYIYLRLLNIVVAAAPKSQGSTLEDWIKKATKLDQRPDHKIKTFRFADVKRAFRGLEEKDWMDQVKSALL